MTMFIRSFVIILLILGSGLTLVNFYGLTQNLRPDNIEIENLRFGDIDVSLNKEELLQSSKMLPNENPIDYSKRLTSVIANGIAHIHWERYDSSKFNQLVPIWENWTLYAMGKFSGIPEYERYHYSNPQKSMERGIGICGDASIIMSQVLKNSGIESKIISFPGHVMVAANIQNQSFVFDPDFGVVLESSLKELNKNPELVDGAYSAVGHPVSDDNFFTRMFKEDYQVWDGVAHFITKKYYFEKLAYAIKWPIPIAMIIVSIWIILRSSSFRKTKVN
jgi:hypothetical protein